MAIQLLTDPNNQSIWTNSPPNWYSTNWFTFFCRVRTPNILESTHRLATFWHEYNEVENQWNYFILTLHNYNGVNWVTQRVVGENEDQTNEPTKCWGGNDWHNIFWVINRDNNMCYLRVDLSSFEELSITKWPNTPIVSFVLGDDGFWGDSLNGEIAEVGLWSWFVASTLHSREGTALNNNISPYFIRPNTLIGYWPLNGHLYNICSNSSNLTATNNPEFVNHCPIIM